MDDIPGSDKNWPELHWKIVKRIVEDGKRIPSASSVEDVLRENGFEVVQHL